MSRLGTEGTSGAPGIHTQHSSRWPDEGAQRGKKSSFDVKNLEKIVIKINRKIPQSSDATIKRDLLDPASLTIPRRPVIMKKSLKKCALVRLMTLLNDSFTLLLFRRILRPLKTKHGKPNDEGKQPIFDRQEILEFAGSDKEEDTNTKKEDEKRRRRRSGRRHSSRSSRSSSSPREGSSRGGSMEHSPSRPSRVSHKSRSSSDRRRRKEERERSRSNHSSRSRSRGRTRRYRSTSRSCSRDRSRRHSPLSRDYMDPKYSRFIEEREYLKALRRRQKEEHDRRLKEASLRRKLEAKVSASSRTDERREFDSKPSTSKDTLKERADDKRKGMGKGEGGGEAGGMSGPLPRPPRPPPIIHYRPMMIPYPVYPPPAPPMFRHPPPGFRPFHPFRPHPNQRFQPPPY